MVKWNLYGRTDRGLYVWRYQADTGTDYTYQVTHQRLKPAGFGGYGRLETLLIQKNDKLDKIWDAFNERYV